MSGVRWLRVPWRKYNNEELSTPLRLIAEGGNHEEFEQQNIAYSSAANRSLGGAKLQRQY